MGGDDHDYKFIFTDGSIAIVHDYGRSQKEVRVVTLNNRYENSECIDIRSTWVRTAAVDVPYKPENNKPAGDWERVAKKNAVV